MYFVVKENAQIENENYVTYGIVPSDDSRFMLHDVTVDMKEAYRIADLLTKNKVELVHFKDVVEDEIQ